jgi:predicted RNA binding protein YcfA (HicA-like mRNA interferase family)
MAKREKLRQRIEQNPKNVRFRDLQTLLETYGFQLKRTKGSHHSFVGVVLGTKTTLVVPYQQPLQPVYVKKALELIQQIEAETGNEEENGE